MEFLTTPRVQTGSGAHSASYPMGARAPSLEIRLLEREAEELWKYDITALIHLHGIALN
jgi:hypothetical protein